MALKTAKIKPAAYHDEWLGEPYKLGHILGYTYEKLKDIINNSKVE